MLTVQAKARHGIKKLQHKLVIPCKRKRDTESYVLIRNRFLNTT